MTCCVVSEGRKACSVAMRNFFWGCPECVLESADICADHLAALRTCWPAKSLL